MCICIHTYYIISSLKLHCLIDCLLICGHLCRYTHTHTHTPYRHRYVSSDHKTTHLHGIYECTCTQIRYLCTESIFFFLGIISSGIASKAEHTCVAGICACTCTHKAYIFTPNSSNIHICTYMHVRHLFTEADHILPQNAQAKQNRFVWLQSSWNSCMYMYTQSINLHTSSP
jgi:hypothetical protein